MFISNCKDYNTEKIIADMSMHGGVPKQFYTIKNKTFNDWEIPPWELFIFTNKVLGEGAFSKVYLAKWRETFVVAKVINNELVDAKKFLIEREIEIMSKLHHPNIVQFLGYIDNPFIIIMEYIPNGNLEDRIPHLSRKEKKNIMKNILQGLAYFHERLPHALIHRDIKSTNILLTNSNFAKIADFGLSKLYSLEKTFSANDLSKLDSNNTKDEIVYNVGTQRYQAPELKCNNVYYNKKYTNKIDIYSAGIVLYEMFENKKHIPGNKFTWFWCPKKIRYIIENYMLNPNPNERYTALNILKHINNKNL